MCASSSNISHLATSIWWSARDGLHSCVRELAFGPEQRFETYLGYHVTAFQIEGYRPQIIGLHQPYPAGTANFALFHA